MTALRGWEGRLDRAGADQRQDAGEIAQQDGRPGDEHHQGDHHVDEHAGHARPHVRLEQPHHEERPNTTTSERTSGHVQAISCLRQATTIGPADCTMTASRYAVPTPAAP